MILAKTFQIEKESIEFNIEKTKKSNRSITS